MPTVALSPMDVIAGRYEVRAPLGEGGMGAVFRVLDRELDEEVALKVLHPRLASTPEALVRFRREVKLARRITHTNVARTYDLGVDGERCFITMELLRGESLARRARDSVPLAEALKISAGVARGLAAAHAEGIVHRDLKPENVMLSGERVVITDFGIARAEAGAGHEGQVHATVSLVGTPAYMSPEQVEGVPVDGRSDVYALGILLFELLTGRLPFAADTPIAVATARLLHEPPDPRTLVDVPQSVAALVLAALARHREHRPDAQTMVNAIDELRGFGSANERGGGSNLASSLDALAEMGQQTATIEARFVRVLAFDGGAALSSVASDLTRAVEDAIAADKTARLVRGTALVPAPRASSSGAGSVSAPVPTRMDADTLTSGDAPSVRERPTPGPGSMPSRSFARPPSVQVLEGTVRASGPNARVRIRLLDAEGAVVDVDRVDGSLEAPFELEDHVTERALALVKKRFASGRRGPPGPLAARFERAREAFEKFDLANLLGALRELEILHLEAPDDPFVTSLLANALVRRWSQEGGTDGALLARAEDLVLRALDTDQDVPDTYYAMASLRQAQGDVLGSFRAALEAQSRGPRFYEPHYLIGSILFEVGHVAEGMRRLELAARLGPKSVLAHVRLANAAALLGERNRSDEIFARVRSEAGPLSTIVAELDAASWYGDQAYALELADRVSLAPAGAAWRRSEPFLRSFADGTIDPERTRQAFREMTNERVGPTRRAGMHRVAADFLARLQLYEDCLDHVTKVSQLPVMVYISWLDRSPSLSPVRSDPRFAEARARVAARVAAMGF